MNVAMKLKNPIGGNNPNRNPFNFVTTASFPKYISQEFTAYGKQNVPTRPDIKHIITINNKLAEINVISLALGRPIRFLLYKCFNYL